MTRDVDAQIISAEWLFVETLDDLRRRCHEPNERTRYELLGIAPLLRKVLIDSTPLLSTIRRVSIRGDLPLRFRIRPWTDSPDGTWDAFAPDDRVSFGGPEIVGDANDAGVTHKAFNSTVVALVRGAEVSVKDIIRYYAHIEGGVHFGRPKESWETVLNDMTTILLGHSTGQIQLLAYLAQIVTRALDPLRRSILTNPSIIVPVHQRNADGYYHLHWTTEYYERANRRNLHGTQPA